MQALLSIVTVIFTSVQTILSTYQKQIEVVFLLLVLLSMDHLKIDDQYVRYTVMALIGARTGWHGLNAVVGMATGNSAAASPPADPPGEPK